MHVELSGNAELKLKSVPVMWINIQISIRKGQNGHAINV